MERLIERSTRLTIVFEFCPWVLRRAGNDPQLLGDQFREYGFDLFDFRNDELVPVEDLVATLKLRNLIARNFTSFIAIKDT